MLRDLQRSVFLAADCPALRGGTYPHGRDHEFGEAKDEQICTAPGVMASSISVSGPFTGSLTETWESFPNYNVVSSLPNPATIMGGGASIENPAFGMQVYEPSAGANVSLGFVGCCSVYAGTADGNKAMVAGGRPFIVFDTPVTRFGAYWGALFPATVGVRFLDESNN